MTELSDEKLCELARSGDASARDRLVARYFSLVGMRASAYLPVGGFEHEDLGQEGFIGLIGAIDKYDPSFGASFRTFALLNIDRRITDAVRAALRKKQVPDSAKVDVAEIEGDSDPENTAILRDTLRRVTEGIEKRTSDFERKVMKLSLSGCTYSQIASRLGCSAKSVENALGRVRRKLDDCK